jgi:hypothetical protein
MAFPFEVELLKSYPPFEINQRGVIREYIAVGNVVHAIVELYQSNVANEDDELGRMATYRTVKGNPEWKLIPIPLTDLKLVK